MIWQVAFGIEQAIFIFALGWFIRLLISFSKDLHLLEKRVEEVEKKQAVNDEWQKGMIQRLERIENKIDKLFIFKGDK